MYSNYRYAKHRWSASYVTYYCMWFRLFATALVPLTALIYFNGKIVIYYRENNFTKAYIAMRKLNQAQPTGEKVTSNAAPADVVEIAAGGVNQLPGTLTTVYTTGSLASNNQGPSLLRSSSKTPTHKTSRERALFIMLCCITFTFFICHLPR